MLWEKHRFVLYDMNGTIEIMNRKDFSQLCPKHSDLSESEQDTVRNRGRHLLPFSFSTSKIVLTNSRICLYFEIVFSHFSASENSCYIRNAS